jgi:hypothetical protein
MIVWIWIRIQDINLQQLFGSRVCFLGETNPNQLTAQQMHGSMERYGYLAFRNFPTGHPSPDRWIPLEIKEGRRTDVAHNCQKRNTNGGTLDSPVASDKALSLDLHMNF